MKKTYMLMTIVFSIIFSAVNPFAALAESFSGNLEGISGNSISGWAWDSTDPESSAVVRIVVKNQLNSNIVGDFTAIAKNGRSDLANLGKGDGNYGFNVSMDWSKVDDGRYAVDAYVGDQKISNSLIYQKGDGGMAGNMKSLGVFKTTGYCPCHRCSEGWGRQTSTGALASSNHTIAVDPRVIPYGSKVMINGVIYRAEDRGGAVKGKHVDIYFDTHGETRQHGTRTAEVFLIQ